MIALGSDHGGFEIKESIKKFFQQESIKHVDFGCYTTESVDYPQFAKKIAHSIQLGESRLGILCCGTGIGISIAANKFDGIRAAVCTNEFCAQMSRNHNDANVLCLGGRVIDCPTAVNLVKIFLKTPFQWERHQKRINQISQIERGEL